jgi:hypothetical protein
MVPLWTRDRFVEESKSDLKCDLMQSNGWYKIVTPKAAAKPEAGLLNDSSCLALALGVT